MLAFRCINIFVFDTETKLDTSRLNYCRQVPAFIQGTKGIIVFLFILVKVMHEYGYEVKNT